MGYMFYDTPHGAAGYGVDDVCHVDDCETTIDRGLEYLCGDHPINPEQGCGWWFCGEHLFFVLRAEQSLCGACLGALEAEEEASL